MTGHFLQQPRALPIMLGAAWKVFSPAANWSARAIEGTDSDWRLAWRRS